MWTFETLVLVAVIFLFAGMVKGIVGLGMPTIALALLAATVGIKLGVALMLVPSFVTNIWQAAEGGNFRTILRRLGLFLAAAVVGVWFGVGVLARADAALISGIFGFTLCLYSIYSLATPQIGPPGRYEKWLALPMGAASGFTAGLTGSMVVPGVLYLQALGFTRDELIQAMGITFCTVLLVFGIALGEHRLMSRDIMLLSAFGLAPGVIGMWLGRRARKRIPEARFRQVFFCALLLLGVYLAARAFL